MLEPGTRTLLFDALRPPDGFKLAYAIGTTFSLDLVTALTAPVAFTWFDRGADGEALKIGSVEVIESVRRYAGRMALFCQGGRILLPHGRPQQLAFLEGSVFQCVLNNGGVFHPKVWVLRFTADGRDTQYRFLCLSRNLTLSRAWDTVLQLDGTLGSRPQRRNDPLAAFIRALPGLVPGGVSEPVHQEIEKTASELTTVTFELPEGVDEARFWPIGTGERPTWPFRDLGSRTLVISPFVTVGQLERLAQNGRQAVLISTPEALRGLARRPHGYEQFWTLHERAQGEAAEAPALVGEEAASTESETELAGLHAKCYVSENGGVAHVWTGSANATEAAFTRNVEFLVQLSGRKRDLGLDTLLGQDEDRNVKRLSSLLTRQDALVAETGQDDAAEKARACFDEVRRLLACSRLSAKVLAGQGADSFDVVLQVQEASSLVLPTDVDVVCWPVTVPQAHARPCKAGAVEVVRFSGLTFQALTAFYAFRVRLAGCADEPAFVVRVPLEGAPEDRIDRILRSLVGDPARLLRFFALLLADEGLDGLFGEGAVSGVGVGDERRSGGQPGAGLLESLLRVLDRSPERLDEVERFIRAMGQGVGNDGKPLLPEGFERLWETVWTIRQRMRA